MPSFDTKLHLVLPGLFELVPKLASSELEPAAPQLQRLLSRAQPRPAAGTDYLGCLFSLFGHPLSDKADLPEAAVNYLLDGGGVQDQCYMRADPVHLRADRDRLLLFDSTQLALTQAEAEIIAADFNRYFAEEPFRLLTPRPSRWYLSGEPCPELCTHGLFEVAGHPIESFMPRGAEAGRWRCLLNEMQMLLFQSPVNQRREAAGRLTVNGIWVSGIGRLPRLEPAGFTRIYAEDPTAAGLAHLAKVHLEPIPAQDRSPWAAGEERLMILTDLIPPVLQGDAQRWMAVLQTVERRLDQLLGQMQRHKQASLVLYPCHGRSYTLSRGRLRRFWRRPKKLSHYAS